VIQLFKPFVYDEAKAAVQKVLASGWIGQGPETVAFEKEFAEYIGCRFAVALNSATSALHLAMIVSGVQSSDKVITTPMTFVSTNHVIKYQRASTVFCDIEPDTLNIDLKQAATYAPYAKAIMVVHYGGNPVDIDYLYWLRDRHGLAVIEDAAHACGAEFNGKKIGSYGLTCFSFHAVKNLPCGDGGMITTNDQALYERLLQLRWCGIDKSTFQRTQQGSYKWEYDVPELGYKYHMNDINAAMGRVHLTRLDNDNQERRDKAALYRVGLKGVEFLRETSGSKNAQHLFVIKSDNREAIIEKLNAANIDYGVHYKPNHLYPMYAQYGYKLPVAEEMYKKILSLPMHLTLWEPHIKKVIEVVNSAI